MVDNLPFTSNEKSCTKTILKKLMLMLHVKAHSLISKEVRKKMKMIYSLFNQEVPDCVLLLFNRSIIPRIEFRAVRNVLEKVQEVEVGLID